MLNGMLVFNAPKIIPVSSSFRLCVRNYTKSYKPQSGAKQKFNKGRILSSRQDYSRMRQKEIRAVQRKSEELHDKFLAVRDQPVVHCYQPPKPEAWVYNLQRERLAIVKLKPEVWATEIRKDIVHRVVCWQRARWRMGNAKSKDRSEVNYSTRKLYRQKGTGNARVGSRRSPTRIGGGNINPKIPRDFGYDLQMRVRQQALRCALSAKYKEGNMVIFDNMVLYSHKSQILRDIMDTYWDDIHQIAFVHGNKEQCPNFILAARSMKNIQFYKAKDIETYNLVRAPQLVVTRAGLKDLEYRLNVEKKKRQKIEFVSEVPQYRLIDRIGTPEEKAEIYG